jgi:hypothetical protein
LQVQKWKLDKRKFIFKIVEAFFVWWLFPTVIFEIFIGNNVPIQGDTYFAVFAVLLLIKIAYLFMRPPMYQEVEDVGKK